LRGAPISRLIVSIEILANVLSLCVAHSDRLKRFLQEARNRYETRWSPRYGYLFVLANCAVWSALTCMTLIESAIADLIGFDLLAIKSPLRLGLHVIAFFCAATTIARLERFSREPLKWLFIFELAAVFMVLVIDLISASTINPYIYPTLVFATGGFFITRSSTITEYMEYMRNIGKKAANIRRHGASDG
jgi:hypothetical protein